MKLSIITINFNNKAGLQKTIDSIVSQTWRDFEWIVVDGGSTDGSKELIEKYAQLGCFAWWCSEPDKGVYNAMNKGIAHANGEYLNFMNSGDQLHEKTTLEHVFESKNCDCDILYGDVIYVFEDNHEERRIAKHPLTFSHLYESTIYHQGSFLKKSLFDYSNYDESYKIVSDWKKWIELTLENRSFVYIPIPIANMDTTGVSMTNDILLHQERRSVLDTILSPIITRDMEEINKWRERESWNPEIPEVYRLINKRRFYKRLIQWNLKFISLIEKIYG